ncbi:hypothetical protein [Halobacteriovorax sp. JY17]|uniref:hypothetical protein n=1 Tax=Halobacteriovorax sp. JY17 TaxID=2014617 RepID=UPI000C4FE813|nr:hypothetical protein [Halobacteriovorax sp. JY17]PIK14120.1 MAG: hypothetical protein CES88_14150 [Halobacteriovorax sp. JY17]
MAESSKEKFTGLNVSEITSKISSFINGEKPIRVWSKGEEPVLAFVRNYEKQVLTLDISNSLIESHQFSSRVFVNFSYNNVDYFAKGDLISDENGRVLINLGEDVFKSEKRSNERLLTFPHHQVYAYFKVFSDENSSNIISLNRFNEAPSGALDSFVSERMKSIVNDHDGISELMGFRILDISSNGLSFCANNRETGYFVGLEDDGDVEFTLMFEEKPYSLRCAEIVYIVDYVNARASKIPMKKIGVHFNENEELKNHLLNFMDSSGVFREVDKNIESFLAD